MTVRIINLKLEDTLIIKFNKRQELHIWLDACENISTKLFMEGEDA